MEGGVLEFLQKQECHNICLAAYKEFMIKAVKLHSWVQTLPAVGNIDELQRVFKDPPSPGMTTEYSAASGDLPIGVSRFISIMTDVKEWVEVFCDIVHCKTCEVAPGVMNEFVPTGPETRYNIQSLRAINAELVYPMPCGSPRRISFIRFVKEVRPDVFAVVDVSTDYFPNFNSTWNANCKRRPSGVIVRKHGKEQSAVIWIENMEVPECNITKSIYSDVKINLAFDAKRWMSMVSTQEKWISSKVVTFRLPTTDYVYDAQKSLLALAKKLKTKYLSYVAEFSNQDYETGLDSWDKLEDKAMKVWMENCAQGNRKFTAMTTFRVKATPRSVFTFLVKRAPQLQLPRLVEMAEPEEVVKFLSDDDSICVLHANRMKQTDSSEQQAAKRLKQTDSSEQQAAKKLKQTYSGEQHTNLECPEDYQYVLQEASSDDYCSLVILSPPIGRHQLNNALRFNKDSFSLKPVGFSIIPDGSQGLLSDASIITVAWQQEHDANVVPDEVVVGMIPFAKVVINMIEGAFKSRR